MKTVIINGSMRKNGNTQCLIDVFTGAVSGEVFTIDAANRNIKPCINCRYCRRHDCCAIQDDMAECEKLIAECDVFVLASPVYFSNFTSPLLAVVSRFQRIYCHNIEKRPSNGIKQRQIPIRPKQGLVLLTGGGSTTCFAGLERTVQDVFLTVNARFFDSIGSFHTDTIPACEDIPVMRRVRQAAQMLNYLCADK